MSMSDLPINNQHGGDIRNETFLSEKIWRSSMEIFPESPESMGLGITYSSSWGVTMARRDSTQGIWLRLISRNRARHMS